MAEVKTFSWNLHDIGLEIIVTREHEKTASNLWRRL